MSRKRHQLPCKFFCTNPTHLSQPVGMKPWELPLSRCLDRKCLHLAKETEADTDEKIPLNLEAQEVNHGPR